MKIKDTKFAHFIIIIISQLVASLFKAGGGSQYQGKIKRGLSTERVRLATFRVFDTQLARLGTFRDWHRTCNTRLF